VLNFSGELVRCPLCGGTNMRSKVADDKGWWYICDDWEKPHCITFDSPESNEPQEIDLREPQNRHGNRMFYYNPATLELETKFGVCTIVAQEFVSE
jgi:ssDNA-binding Zn-finger/Zn-ribbon topoisomerase 1